MAVDQFFKFQRALRLTRPEEYAEGLKTRVAVRGLRFALHLRPNDFTAWRLGLVIPKRIAPNAVERNTVKRVWRELFRLSQARLQATVQGNKAYDLVIRLLPKPASESKVSRMGSVKFSSALRKRAYYAEATVLLAKLESKLASTSGVESTPGLLNRP